MAKTPQEAADELITDHTTNQQQTEEQNLQTTATSVKLQKSTLRTVHVPEHLEDEEPEVTWQEVKDLFNNYMNSWTEFSLKDLMKNGLALGATIATAFMSFAGAVALGATFPFAVTAMVLTALVSLQVNKEITDAALDELEIFILGIKNKLFPKTDDELTPKYLKGAELRAHQAKLNKIKNAHLWRDSASVFLSILAAISFSATSLYAAAGLFSFNVALGITVICSPAMFLMSFNIIVDSWRIIKKDILGNIFSSTASHSTNDASTIQEEATAFQELTNSLNKGSKFRKWMTVALCAAMTAITFYYAKATWSTWWTETELGLSLAFPALFLSRTIFMYAINFGNILRTSSAVVGAAVHSLFIIKNSLEAILKSSANLDAAFNKKSPLLEKIKSTPALKFNPAFWATVVVGKISSISLFLLHSLCHSLMGSRDWSVIAGTVTDAASDLNFVSEHSHGEDEHTPHGHEPWDFIVMSFQFIVLTAPFVFPLLLPISLPLVFYFPLGLASVAWHFAQSRISNPSESWQTQLSTSIKDTYFFASDYIKSKRCHGETTHSDNIVANTAAVANDAVYNAQPNHSAQPQVKEELSPHQQKPVAVTRGPILHTSQGAQYRSNSPHLGHTSCMKPVAHAEAGLMPCDSKLPATPAQQAVANDFRAGDNQTSSILDSMGALPNSPRNSK